MLRKDPADKEPDGTKLTQAECEHLAEQFVDLILDPGTPWVRQALLTGLQMPKLSREVARQMGFTTKLGWSRLSREFAEALQGMDRERLVELVKSEFLREPPTKEVAQAFLRGADASVWRKAIQEGLQVFKGHPGPRPKIAKRDYPKIAALADRLRPVIHKLLVELASGTQHTISELLGFWRVDHPGACTFLLHHITRLEQALKDQRLLQRARKVGARAALLADALAGSDYNLSFRTSIERVREGRRQQARQS